MYKREKIMVSGAFVLLIGIIIMLLGYNKYKGVEAALTMAANGTPPGVAEATIGILIAVGGAFIAIYGFGLLPEEIGGHSTK